MRPAFSAASILLFTAMVALPSIAQAQRDPIKGPMTICFPHSVFRMNADENIDDWKIDYEEVSVRVVGRHGWSHMIMETYARVVDPTSLTLVSTKGNTRRYRQGDSGSYVIFVRPNPDSPRERPLIFGSGPPDGNNDDAFYSRFEVIDPNTVKCGHSFLSGVFLE
jgi:hypothetical protein